MARKVAIVTDSTCDLSPEMVATHGITVIPLIVSLDGQEYRDGVDIRPSEFYRKLTASSGMPTTATPAPGVFAEVYRKLLEDHEQVLSLHISAELSGTLGSATQGAQLLDHPERVKIVDSRLVSIALGLAVLAAARAAEEGGDAEATWERMRPAAEAMRVYFLVDTLEYLRRGGRIGRASALVGSVLQIKPVLCVTDGVVAPMERVRTAEKAMQRLIQLARGDGGRLCAAVGHTAALEGAERLASAIEEQCDTMLMLPVGPVVGAHGGPGVIGLGCYPAELFPLGMGKVTSAETLAT
jgi:DegV family protein with EDD domain